MASEMIERVARAIDPSLPAGPLEPCALGSCNGKAMIAAQAAIEAMRVPSEMMVEAAHTHLAGDGDVSSLFTAMIDAALKDTPHGK